MANETEPKQVGALLIFKSEVEEARVMAWVQKLREAGHLESATVQKFDPSWGQPVWYVP